jgi:CMP-N-acetylneuraminic acid synthetase
MISIFIPIRKGSKRVKNKNIRKIGKFNLGLTEIKIKQIIKLKKILGNRHKIEFVIATNCLKTLKYCKNFEWIKTYKRSESISGDHSLNKLINLVPKICEGKFILWTHVTSPLFSSNCYYDFIKSFYRKNTRRSAFTADLIQKFLYQGERKWISHNNKKNKWPRSQDLKPTFVVNSAAFIASRKTYVKARDRLCKNPYPLISKGNTGFDIDTRDDFKKLKKLSILI